MGPIRVAIACQGGGRHTAFTAGVLQGLFREWNDDEAGVDEGELEAEIVSQLEDAETTAPT